LVLLAKTAGEIKTKLHAAALAFFVLLNAMCGVQAQSPGQALITQNIREGQLVSLAGNTRKEMTPNNDRGLVDDGVVLQMYLQLNRAPEVQQAMDDLVNRLHDLNSSQYHHWLTSDQIATRFKAWFLSYSRIECKSTANRCAALLVPVITPQVVRTRRKDFVDYCMDKMSRRTLISVFCARRQVSTRL
jgi:hypothetical protein